MSWHVSVSASGLNLRPTPDTTGAPLVVLPRGTRLEVLGTAGLWLRVTTPDREGYVHGGYVQDEHTDAADLVTVATPYPTTRPVLLHRRAAASLARVFASLSREDRLTLCSAVRSSFRSWASQEAMVRSYEAAIGEAWKPWRDLTPEQEQAARKAGFAYHPGYPVDAPHTHVGGGALDLAAPLPSAVRVLLTAEGWRQDVPGDVVHWSWRG